MCACICVYVEASVRCLKSGTFYRDLYIFQAHKMIKSLNFVHL